jgi:hypothetical protein
LGNDGGVTGSYSVLSGDAGDDHLGDLLDRGVWMWGRGGGC